MYYELTKTGLDPVLLKQMKEYLKVPNSADDNILLGLIASATAYGEKYTGREFKANTWTLFVDQFSTRILIDRSPVDAITSVQNLVSDALVTIPDSVYYLKTNQVCSELLLKVDQQWPDDTDEIEHGIQIKFVTKAYNKAIDEIKSAIKRHVAYMYYSRGDCPESGFGLADNDSASLSGAKGIYNGFKILRI